MRAGAAFVLPGCVGLVLAVLLGACGTQPRASRDVLDAAALASLRGDFASADEARIAQALSEIHDARPPLDWLVAGLADADRGVREWSAHALGDLAPRRPDVLRALMRAFEDPDDWVRWKAARALGNLGPYAAPALPLLRTAAAQQQEVVRAASEKAVRQITGAE